MNLATNTALKQVSPHLQGCIEECLSCHAACLSALTYCMQKGLRHAEPEHLRRLADCAEICETSANFMLRGSDQHRRTCEVCAELCEQCAASCEKMSDDAAMKACADACRRCAESCRKMATGS